MEQKALVERFQLVRSKTESLCQPLAIEDYVIQSMPDVSPPKWHLAHTSWFFETFLIVPFLKDYQVFNPLFHYLFNSYYQSLGQPFPRVQRGLLSRPTVNEIFSYRAHVDQHLLKLLVESDETVYHKIQPLIILGLHHEQQHQELMLMDIKHNFSLDPHFPVYFPQTNKKSHDVMPLKWQFIEVETVEMGYIGNEFCFDNELPRHKQMINPFAISNRLVTNGEYIEFIASGGYQNPEWWLADGWDFAQKNNWQAPLYWHKEKDHWKIFTLSGLQELNLAEPVAHISYYEADAYARFRSCRLPSEIEWECYANSEAHNLEHGNFLETNLFHPRSALNSPQLLGDLWEWTASAYSPYPGYKSLSGALGEYNGKFMSNQMVLRGGSCATPASHIRTSYRNFFQPEKRWAFSGIRLVDDK